MIAFVGLFVVLINSGLLHSTAAVYHRYHVFPEASHRWWWSLCHRHHPGDCSSCRDIFTRSEHSVARHCHGNIPARWVTQRDHLRTSFLSCFSIQENETTLVVTRVWRMSHQRNRTTQRVLYTPHWRSHYPAVRFWRWNFMLHTLWRVSIFLNHNPMKPSRHQRPALAHIRRHRNALLLEWLIKFCNFYTHKTQLTAHGWGLSDSDCLAEVKPCFMLTVNCSPREKHFRFTSALKCNHCVVSIEKFLIENNIYFIECVKNSIK